MINDELMELKHGKFRFRDKIELTTHNNKKLKCRKVTAVLRYHQSKPQQNNEQHAHHLLFKFYPFRDEAYLKSPYLKHILSSCKKILLMEIRP